MFDVIGLHALFGFSVPISKKLLQFAPPFFLSGFRMMMAGAILLGFNWIRNKNKKKNGKVAAMFQRKDYWLYAQMIFIGVYLKYILRYWGLNYTSAAKMSFFINMSPLIAALLSYIFLREKLTNKQWMGMAIGFIGYVPIIMTSSSAEKLMGEAFFISWPEIALFMSVFAHCYGMILARKMVRNNNYNASMANGIRMFGGGILALLTAFVFEGFFPVENVVSFSGWFFALIILSNLICHNFQVHLLKYYTVTFIIFTEFLSTIFTTFYSWLFFGEVITWHYPIAAIVIVSGLYTFYQDELRNIYVAKPKKNKKDKNLKTATA